MLDGAECITPLLHHSTTPVSTRPMSLNELSANHSFLRLEDLLLPPPLPAIVSLLIVLGTLNLSTLGARWLKTENKTPIELAAVFVITTGLLAALVHAVAWAGYACLPMLRWIAWALAALGVLELSKWKPGKVVSLLGEYWREGSRVERFALIVSVLTLIGLFAAALGPAIDADSLDYHLAVPLDWLRHGGAYPRPDWFTARYVGLGESLNMLGLAAGTDGLGAAFQAAGLIVALLGVTAFAKTQADQLFAVLLVVACPIIVPLIINQKPQLLPAAALTVALVILVQRFKIVRSTDRAPCLRLCRLRHGKQALLLAHGQCSRVCRTGRGSPGAATSFGPLGVGRLLCDSCCARIRTELCLLRRPSLAVARTVATGR